MDTGGVEIYKEDGDFWKLENLQFALRKAYQLMRARSRLLWWECGMSCTGSEGAHLVPSWWHYLGSLWNLWEVKSCCRKWTFRFYGEGSLPVHSLLIHYRCNLTSQPPALATTLSSLWWSICELKVPLVPRVACARDFLRATRKATDSHGGNASGIRLGLWKQTSGTRVQTLVLRGEPRGGAWCLPGSCSQIISVGLTLQSVDIRHFFESIK